VYGYLNKLVSLEETVDQIAAGPEPPVEVFVQLIKTVARKMERGKPDPD
jgi:hypothetical protein